MVLETLAGSPSGEKKKGKSGSSRSLPPSCTKTTLKHFQWYKLFMPEQGSEISVNSFDIGLDDKSVTFNGEYTSTPNLRNIYRFPIIGGTFRAKFETTFTFSTSSSYVRIKMGVDTYNYFYTQIIFEKTNTENIDFFYPFP